MKLKPKDCLNWNQKPNYMKVKGLLEKKLHEVKWVYETRKEKKMGQEKSY